MEERWDITPTYTRLILQPHKDVDLYNINGGNIVVQKRYIESWQGLKSLDTGRVKSKNTEKSVQSMVLIPTSFQRYGWCQVQLLRYISKTRLRLWYYGEVFQDEKYIAMTVHIC
jgi:hypothetical protein